MNAKQRRQIERRVCLKVVFRYRSHDDLDDDDLDEEVEHWCNKQIGRENWRISNNWRRDQGGWVSRGYFIAESKHAMLFALRWL